MALVVAGPVGGDMTALSFNSQFAGRVLIKGDTTYRIDILGTVQTVSGIGLTYGHIDNLVGGMVTGFVNDTPGIGYIEITGFELEFRAFQATLGTEDALSEALRGHDLLLGGDGTDILSGYGGNDSISGGARRDVLSGGGGDDTVYGGAGNDKIYDGGGSNYLRGDDGNDSIRGSAGFDDIHGNAGNDTCASGGGDDWVVGGKDNDSLVGSSGQNIVYGNLGADTCEGGAGDDIVRGGQDDDIVLGGDGADYVSGDMGDDTLTGGLGADDFHSFGEAGVDRVLDFNRSEGDRVRLDAGTIYTVSQVGADTVIDMIGGGKVILVDVSLSNLTNDWIFIG